ncbi:hypothetical protein NP233_g10294 [Leucocoprinus birnbaumii]|uniref:Xylanolytic transcriptional activator regulatory domain-containing protein n=1 Tax=Leucocoprinus birnbaumii TaxID=56174 RepID=A0AAD5VKL8_9AGAR|nr:hypothetical protein NP233_g10294 [Leucocoprinus birnbaumii]
MDKLLTKLLPGIDLTQEVDRLLEEVDEQGVLINEEPDDLDGQDAKLMVGKLAKLDLNPPQNRFFGKSSGYHLIQTALDLKSQYKGSVTTPSELKRRRNEFWEIPPWVSVNPETEDTLPPYTFPPLDLIGSLVEHYFTQINPFLPLLHRPTFQQGIDESLHYSDQYFGAVVLLVCALGSRYSEDPRIFVEGSNTARSAGWKWFEQLSVLYSQSSQIPQGCWSQVGMALRLAQEVGAHRRRPPHHNHTPSAEEELWKRAFWVLMSIDRLTSSGSGRPCGLQDEDFDLELPIDCDDEYWDHPDPSKRFKQPEGKPSSISFFNCYLSLMDILAYAMRAIYAIKRPKNMFGRIIQRSDQQVIAELDSAMNNWMDSVPPHLRWNPSCENKLFLKQSAALYATYYQLQIFIHRPFIPSPRNRTSVTFPSLAICTNAARSCCHVLESYSRISHLPLPYLQSTVFLVAVVLLLNIWSGKRTGFAPHPKREMEDVQRCMNMLKSCETRWSQAGRYSDILYELANAGDVTIENHPPPPPSSPPSRKRQRTESNEFVPPTTTPLVNSDNTQSVPTTAAAPPTFIPPLASTTLPTGHDVAHPNFSLPVYGTDLGRLPVYGQFGFLDTVAASQQEMARQIQMAFPAASMFPGHYFSQQQLLQHAMLQPQLYTQFPGAMSIPGAASSLTATEGGPATLFNGQLNGSIDPQISPMVSAMSTGVSSPESLDIQDVMPAQNGCDGPLLDNDSMSMWLSAPTSFELDEWRSYISSVNQMTHGLGDSFNGSS